MAPTGREIAGFGSVGAEYRLSFGKRVIYLKTPQKIAGGADLIFRDRFADAICEVKELEKTIISLLEKSDLTDIEKEEMGKQVLYSYGTADEKAASAIDKILTQTS